jgi:hypothetical protein
MSGRRYALDGTTVLRAGDVVRFDELPVGAIFEFVPDPSTGRYWVGRLLERKAVGFREKGYPPGEHGTCYNAAALCLIREKPEDWH